MRLRSSNAKQCTQQVEPISSDQPRAASQVRQGGHVTRRSLLQSGAAAGAGMALMGTLTGCLPIASGSSNIDFYNVKDYGAFGDGTSDDTAAIQSAMNAMPTTGGALLFPPSSGAYRFGQINVTTPCRIIFNGCELTANAAPAHGLFFITASDVTMEGLAIVSGNAQATNFVVASGGSRVHLRAQLTVTGFTGYVVSTYEVNDLEVANLTSSNPAGTIYYNGGSRSLFEDIAVLLTSGSVGAVPIFIGSNRAPLMDVSLCHCQVDGTGASPNVSAFVIGPNTGIESRRITIENCTTSNYSHDAIDILACEDVVVRGFLADTTEEISVIATNVLVADCVAYHAAGPGFVAGDPGVTGTCKDVRFENCAAVGCGQANPGTPDAYSVGFLVMGNSQLTIDTVQFTGCRSYDDGSASSPQAWGICAYQNATNVTVTNCDCRGNGTGSVYVGTDSVDTVLAREVLGYNPVGSVTVPVPNSGTPVSAVPYDRYFYVETGSSSCSCAITNEAGASPTVVKIPAASFTGVKVPAGSTLTPTYNVAPAWTVQGD